MPLAMAAAGEEVYIKRIGGKEETRRFLENLNPKQIFVYHMPLQVPDPLRYHEILDRGLAKYSGKAPVRTMNRFMCRLQ